MKRACQDLLRPYLKTFPCVAVIGARQCGKTTLLKSLPRGWRHYDLERRADYDLVSRDPDAFFRLNPGRVAVEIKHASTVSARELRGLREFVSEHKARLGLVITNDSMPRQYEEDLLGLPFNWL